MEENNTNIEPCPSQPPQPDMSAGSYRPSLSHRLAGALRKNNPFYLLSAACMLCGCLLLVNTMTWSPIRLGKLLGLLGTINIYEALLLALGLFLAVKKRGHARDASQLLVLGAVFMADAAFLVSEVVSTKLILGCIIAGLIFLLAVTKVGVALHVLRVKLDPGRWGVIVATLASLFGIPCILKAIGDTNVNGGHLYAAWWAAALIWAVFDIVSRRALSPTGAERSPLSVIALFTVIPWVSLLAHIGILHYVYNENFTAVHAAPMLLAATLIIARLTAQATGRLLELRRILLAGLPLAAIWVSFNPFGHGMFLHIPHVATLTPLMLATGGAYLTLLCVWVPAYIIPGAAVGTVLLGTYLFGPSTSQVSHTASSAWSMITSFFTAIGSAFRWTADALWSFLPKTGSQWGIVAVVLSFGLLGLGAKISLRKDPDVPSTDTGGATI